MSLPYLGDFEVGRSFRDPQHRPICSVTATPAMRTSFSRPPNGWAFTKFSLRPAAHGKTPISRDSSVLFAASAWTISWSSMRPGCVAKDYFQYYEGCRTHLSLEKDAPIGPRTRTPTASRNAQVFQDPRCCAPNTASGRPRAARLLSWEEVNRNRSAQTARQMRHA